MRVITTASHAQLNGGIGGGGSRARTGWGNGLDARGGGEGWVVGGVDGRVPARLDAAVESGRDGA